MASRIDSHSTIDGGRPITSNTGDSRDVDFKSNGRGLAQHYAYVVAYVGTVWFVLVIELVGSHSSQ